MNFQTHVSFTRDQLPDDDWLHSSFDFTAFHDPLPLFTPNFAGGSTAADRAAMSDDDYSPGSGYETDRDDERGAEALRGVSAIRASTLQSISRRSSSMVEESVFQVSECARPHEMASSKDVPMSNTAVDGAEPSTSASAPSSHSFASSSFSPSTASTSYSFAFSAADSRLSDDHVPTPGTSLDSSPDLNGIKGKGKARPAVAGTELPFTSQWIPPTPPQLPPLEFTSPRLPYRVIGWEEDSAANMSARNSGANSPVSSNILRPYETRPSSPLSITASRPSQPSLLTQTLSLNQALPPSRNASTSTISQPVSQPMIPTASHISLHSLGVKLKKSRGSLSLKTKSLLNIRSSSKTPSFIETPSEDKAQSAYTSEREDQPSDGSASSRRSATRPSSYQSLRRKIKGKGRAYTYPVPTPIDDDSSVFYPPPPTPADDVSVLMPEEPVIAQPDYFTTLLPRELKSHIFGILVHLHTEALSKAVEEGTWTAYKAATERWVGKEAGARELVKISRVSKEWQRLAFDGQLWANVDCRPYFPLPLLSRIASTAGPFVRTFDLTEYHGLNTETLSIFSRTLSMPRSPVDLLRGDGTTNLTFINLKGCTSVTSRALHMLLKHSPALQTVCLRGLTAVTNTTCETLAAFCPAVTSLDMSRCANMDAFGIQRIAEGEYRQNRMERPLKELRVSGLKRVSTALLFSLARGLPGLEILDISRAKDLDDAALEAFVQWDPYLTASSTPITLTSRQMGLDPASTTSYTKRLTRLRHLSLSDCQLLTDTACGHLAYAVPLLEFFEFAGIGRGVSDVGLVRMLKSTPLIRRIDLEDASEITNAVIHAITPTLSPRDEWRRGVLIPAPPEPGEALEHIILSYATNLTADAVVGLIRACTHLRVLEVDNTPITDEVVREFVKASRKRKLKEAEVNAVDCRHVGKVVVAELGSAGMVRHRRGWRDWEARNLGYLDSRDEESGSLPGGQDECDENKVALKTFWTWQHVDSALAARDARRKTRMEREEIDAEAERWDPGPSSSRAPRWWASRRSMSVSALPGSYLRGLDDDERGCIIM